MRRALRLAGAIALASTGAAAEDGGAAHGVVVLALEGATAAAWPLAQEVYKRDALRPLGLDESRARILVGEAAVGEARGDVSPALRDLAELRAAVAASKRDDAPTRRLLATIAAESHAQGVVVVALEPSRGDSGDGTPAIAPRPTARVFLASTGGYDAASYRPDDVLAWKPTVESLERSFAGSSTGPVRATRSTSPAARTDARSTGERSRPFYSSPWLWGALGAAAVGGLALFFATRDSDRDTIHVDVQVPR